MKKILTIGIMLLFIGMTISSATGINLEKQSTVVTSGGNILYVGGNGTGNYTKIQDAINDSSDGDTVYVYDDSSPYYENLDINKSIKLIGEDRDTTIIDGNEIIEDVVNISADNVTLSGFTIQNADYQNYTYKSGVYITSNYTSINGNIITNNPYGVYVKYDYYGYYLSLQSYNNISNNIITNNLCGILLDGCNYTNVWNNIVSENNHTGIHFSGTYNSIISRNKITKNRNGVTNLWSGFLGFKNTISYNNISDNEEYGIDISGSPTIINYNDIMNNGRNAFFGYIIIDLLFEGGFCKFNGNYWDRSRILPYPIFGYITLFGFIFNGNNKYSNWIIFDWHPASEPYDIGV